MIPPAAITSRDDVLNSQHPEVVANRFANEISEEDGSCHGNHYLLSFKKIVE